MATHARRTRAASSWRFFHSRLLVSLLRFLALLGAPRGMKVVPLALAGLSVLVLSSHARAQAPTGPPPPRTPQHEAEVRRELDAASVQKQAGPVYAEESSALDRRRYDAWIARGQAAQPSPFRLVSRPIGVDLLGEVRMTASSGIAIGSRLGGYVSVLEWLGVEGRVTLASEAFRRGHDVTGGVYLGARASTPLSKGALVLAGLGLAVERTFTGDGGAPSAVFVPALTLGVRRCVVALPSDAGCVAFAIDLAGVLRLPTDGDSELRRARAGFSFAIGPAVLF